MRRYPPEAVADAQAQVRAYIRERDRPRPMFDAMLVPEGAILPFESPWSVIHKLAWLNGCGPKALLEGYYTGMLRTPSSGWRAPWEWLGDLRWRDRGGAEPQLDGEPLMDALRTRVRTARDMLNRFSELHYCRSCVDLGWHSTLQQWTFGRTCILHGEELRWGCPRCSVRIDTTLAGTFGDAAYACAACEPVAQEDWNPFPKAALLEPFAAVGSELLAWTGLLDKTRVKSPDAHYGRVGPDWKARFDTFSEARTVASVRPPPPRLGAALALEPMRGFTVLTYFVPEGHEIVSHVSVEASDTRQALKAQVVLSETVAAMERAFAADLSANHPCIAEADTAVAGLEAESDVRADPACSCPVSLAWALWRRITGAMCADWSTSPRIRPTLAVTEEVLDKTLRSHFFVLLSDIVARRHRPAPSGELRLPVDTRPLKALMTTSFGLELDPVPVVRGVVDYSEWVGELACMPLSEHWERPGARVWSEG
ncbi:hypothetical protein [Lysobacter xanthus]